MSKKIRQEDNKRMHPRPLLHFWFSELTPEQHFAKDPALDETIRARLGATLEAASRCESSASRATPQELTFLSEPGSSF